MSRYHLLALLVLLPLALLFAQDGDLVAFNELRLQTNKTAMTVLGGWAVGNVAIGAIMMNKREGEDKYFHQMNLGWGAINLGIASLSYYAAMKSDPASYDLVASLQEQNKIKNILLFNAGLDVGYMMGGLYLIERSKNHTDNPARLKGFGKSIVLQGAFLFLFDLAAFIAHKQHDQDLHPILEGLSFNGQSIGLQIAF